MKKSSFFRLLKKVQLASLEAFIEVGIRHPAGRSFVPLDEVEWSERTDRLQGAPAIPRNEAYIEVRRNDEA